MDKNFKVRVVVGFCLFAVAIVSLYTFNSLPFKIFYGAFALISAIELGSFFKRRRSFFLCILAILELAFLAYSIIFVAQTDVAHFWYVILGVPGYDIFAYLFGKLFGGKIFKKSRPFPYVSKNKTWEGTILGIGTAIGMVAILIASRNASDGLEEGIHPFIAVLMNPLMERPVFSDISLSFSFSSVLSVTRMYGFLL